MVSVINIGPSGPVAFGNLHLSPFSETERLREIEIALSALNATGAPARIIAGDLNSLSSQDHYPRNLPARFNDTQRQKFMSGGKLQHILIKRLRSEGYVDTAVEAAPENTGQGVPFG
jgi:endonuclease/exonuclease/phosphatase family metal-dependent hydrolase